ncbi:hypothetical protein ACFQUU_08945 [Herbaspirillum sp. GCM10030257]|uniref:hypothetical protein n=1 Tax=Herbaspirillum sp. GCM10030257 TaxID=3273393 RepID=UPI0036210C9C
MIAKKPESPTPAEQRALRLFRSVPEASRPQFFELMATVCQACGWASSEMPALRAIRKGGE